VGRIQGLISQVFRRIDTKYAAHSRTWGKGEKQKQDVGILRKELGGTPSSSGKREKYGHKTTERGSSRPGINHEDKGILL